MDELERRLKFLEFMGLAVGISAIVITLEDGSDIAPLGPLTRAVFVLFVVAFMAFAAIAYVDILNGRDSQAPIINSIAMLTGVLAWGGALAVSLVAVYLDSWFLQVEIIPFGVIFLPAWALSYSMLKRRWSAA